jgi:hypothetical protein
VLLQRAQGPNSAVTPQDVATSLIQGLNATNPADRTVTLPNVAE